MTDPTSRPEEAPVFETDAVRADRAREQGLGLGEREIAAQRDPGGVRTPDGDAAMEEGASINADDGDALDQSAARRPSDEGGV